jgi:agmatinase
MTSIALLGIPNDDNSSHLAGASDAPPLIRREFHNDAYSQWSETGIDLGAPGRIVDHGDLVFDAGVDAWAHIEATVERILASGNPLLSLGGDHAITHPILRAVRRRQPRLTILHIDAHPDIYDAYQGNRRSHASPFARIMEEQLADRLIQVGLRTVNDHHREQFARFGVETIEASRCAGPLALELTTPVYLSIDLDALDPSCAPGVSHREPGGLTTRQLLDIVQSIRQPIVAADIVEFNPRCDISGMTAGVAAKLLKEVGGMMVRSNEQARAAH